MDNTGDHSSGEERSFVRKACRPWELLHDALVAEEIATRMSKCGGRMGATNVVSMFCGIWKFTPWLWIGVYNGRILYHRTSRIWTWLSFFMFPRFK